MIRDQQFRVSLEIMWLLLGHLTATPAKLFVVSITENLTNERNHPIKDDYEYLVGLGIEYLTGSYLEYRKSTKKGRLYVVSKKNVFFFEDNISYPQHNFADKNKGTCIMENKYRALYNYYMT